MTSNYDIIARFQGGPNAGHTLEFDGIKHVLNDLGIQRGDNVLLHSSFVTISSLVGTPKEAVDDIFDVIGDHGTLLVPAANAEIFKQGMFDVENTPVQSDFGVICEYLKKNLLLFFLYY